MNHIAPSMQHHENDIEWSFLNEADDEKERMCRSLDLDTMTTSRLCPSIVGICNDRSEPSLAHKAKHDDPGLFGSQRVKAMLDMSKTKESFKDRLLSMWTNTKNGFMAKLTQEFKETSDIWMLGKCYKNDVATFKKDFYKLPWITYRRGFPALGSQKMTSDVGWGCMIRCAQMCLAVTLNSHGRSTEEMSKKFDADELLKMFGDRPHPDCPFSIHSLVSSGETKGRSAGSWFGPASISVALREVLKEQQATNELLSNLAIYIAQDSTVFIRDALDEMKIGQRSLMLIIPLRLGFHHVNEVYVDSFKRVFRWKFCVGVMGGRPKHSLFFVGHQDDDLIYLDPHFNQDVVDLDNSSETFSSPQSYHCSTPMKINVARVDPTCAVAFYCADQTDLWELISLVREMEEELKKSRTSSGVAKQIPMLHFVDARHADLLEPDRDLLCKMEVEQEDSIKCDSLESNFCSLGEDLENDVSGKSSELNICRLEDSADMESLQSDVDNPASLSLPIIVGNSQWYVGRFSPRARPPQNRLEEFSFIGDSSVGSYSTLEDARPTRDVDSIDFGFIAAGGSRCNLASRRRMKIMKEMGEEDGFVVL